MSASSWTYERGPVSMRPAASGQNMNASSASGLCDTWIVRAVVVRKPPWCPAGIGGSGESNWHDCRWEGRVRCHVPRCQRSSVAHPGPMSAPFPGQERARHMGELRRGDQRWDVFVETQADGELQAVRGRLHFVNGGKSRSTSWIFLESTDRDIQERFGEFSAVELWHFVASLEG